MFKFLLLSFSLSAAFALTCPTGSTMQTISGGAQCVKPATIIKVCDGNSVLAFNGICEFPPVAPTKTTTGFSCPTLYTLSTQAITANSGTPTAGTSYPICKRPSVSPMQKPMCDNVLSTSSVCIVKPINPTCPTGFNLNATNNSCVSSPKAVPSCHAGVLNPSTNRCETTPLCNSGFVFNPSSAKCETSSTNVYKCEANASLIANQCIVLAK
jgi:hypothetical protein